MPTLNTDLAYKLPPARKAPVVSASLPQDWMIKLIQSIQSIQDNLGSAPSFDLAARLNEHVGDSSTYGLKAQIVEGLRAIYPVMMDAETSLDQKTSIAIKLIERVANCTPGFHDGVNSIVDGFESPQSLDDVLYRIRHDIVSKTANQTTDDVHGNNRFFTVAQGAGFGVRALNPEDVYRGNISDPTIQEKLTAAFNGDYRLFSILRGTEDQVRSELLKLEYTGEREVGYEPAVMEKFVDFLTTLFNDSPAMMKQREAIALQQEYEQRIQDFMRPKSQAVGDIISDIKSQNLVDALITNRFPDALKPKYINGLDDDKKQRIAGIQDHYVQFIKSEDMQSLSARMNESTADRISPFQRVDDKGLHLNWNQIRQAIWEEFRDKHYFTLTELEASALNGLMDNRLPFDVEQGENLSLSGSEVVELFSMQMLSDHKKEGLLRWYIRSAQDTPEHKLTSLAVIQDLGRHDKGIRAVEDALESDIHALNQSVKEGWLNKLTSILNYDELNLPRFLREDKAFMLEAINGHPWVLKHASAALKENREFVLAAVSQNVQALRYASAALKENREFVLAAVSQNGSALEHASAALKENREFVLAAVSQNVQALRYASAALKENREFVLAAVSQNGSALEHASAALKENREFVLAAVSRNGQALEYASAALKENRDFVLAAVSRNGQALGWVTGELRRDRDVVLAAVSQEGSALRHASAELKKDRDVVLAAVRQNASALEHASDVLKKDRDFVLAAVSQNVQALRYASHAFRENREFVLAAVSRNGQALVYASAELKKDRDFVLAAVSRNGQALGWVTGELRRDRDVVLAAVSQEGSALVYASAELKKDRDVVLAAVRQNASALEHASDVLKKDRDVVLAALSQNGSALEYASAALKKNRNFVLAADSQNNEDAFQYASAALQKDSEILLATMPAFVESETQNTSFLCSDKPAPGDNLLKAGIALEAAGIVFFGLGFIPGLQILWAVSVVSFVVGLVIAGCGQRKNTLAIEHPEALFPNS